MTGDRVIGAASLPLIASISLISAAVFQVIAFASSSWGYDTFRHVHVGLWRDSNCYKPNHMDCFNIDHVEYFTEGRTCRIF